MKNVNLTISCRRDYMAVFPVDDKQYKALKNRIKKDGEVNVDEACKKLGRATPLNREHVIEHGLIVAESEPFVRAQIDGIIVFENNVEMTAAVSNPFEYEFVNVDENVSAAFIGEMKNDGFESDEEDDYTISNYLTNNLERIKIESVGYDMEDGQQVLVIYYGGFSENGTLNFDFEIEDNEEFDVNKLHFFRACIEDQCGGLNCSAVAEDFEIFLEDMILYDKKVIGIRDVDIEDYGESETALGEYYPCDCINYE